MKFNNTLQDLKDIITSMGWTIVSEGDKNGHYEIKTEEGAVVTLYSNQTLTCRGKEGIVTQFFKDFKQFYPKLLRIVGNGNTINVAGFESLEAIDAPKRSPETKKEHSDGSTASYYELPEGATQLQHLISAKNMNAQIGEIFRACYRYNQVAHSDPIRDVRKILYYANAELERLEK